MKPKYKSLQANPNNILNYLTFLFIKIAHFKIRLFPSKTLVQLMNYLLIFTSYRKQVINNNYKSTIGAGLSRETFDSFYRNCIQNISRIIVETLKFEKSKSSKLTYFNIENLENLCEQNNGLILMASHYGNWELACINLPLHTSLPCYGVYKPLKNKVMDRELIRLRSRYGLNVIPMNSIARSIATNYKSHTPAIYILIADQNPRSIQNVIWVNFLGIMTAFSNGLVKFQNKYNLPIAYMKTTPNQELFDYNINFEFPDAEGINKSIQWYSQQVENQIRQNPQFWLWSHKRWKRKYRANG